ncbi:hypothetical protein ACJDT4_10670 [Clostridium neuense]|uniref:Anti-bacteriophage protein A/HamA C-terminal domain-containing protein n=1 Tax=Clostridium neuense TaxID=1728934 RepID=A0ABW8TEL5_9CLOT
MAAIKQLLATKTNGLNVKLFEYDIDDEQSYNQLREYLISKVKSSNVHNVENYDLTYFAAKNLKPEFIQKFNEKVAKISIPKKSKVPQFDVRRERVTEWMAQLLLEKEYGCTFYDEADKRMNLKPVEIDKHTDGIDVPGIRIVDNSIKFVICEVKASETEKIPCTSVIASLQDDIQKAVDNRDNRVSREILQYMYGIRNVKFHDDELQRIINFLSHLIAGEKDTLAENIMFFPLLIRNNNKITSNKDTGDYKNFTISGASNNIENIILAFNKSINNFSDAIYKEAIGNE